MNYLFKNLIGIGVRLETGSPAGYVNLIMTAGLALVAAVVAIGVSEVISANLWFAVGVLIVTGFGCMFFLAKIHQERRPSAPSKM